MEHGYAEPGMEGLKEYQGTADEVVAHMDGAEIALTHLAPFSAGVLERLPQLKLIAVSRGGPVNIDMAAARERKIRAVNTPGRNASAVAEFTIGTILAETRLITRGHESLRRGEWRCDLYRADLTGEELSEMTVGVIGYGHIGTKIVRILKAFGCRTLVCDPYVQLSVEDSRDGVVQALSSGFCARATL
jgi:D-3-phosphoglycerate dehydrogenase